MDEHELSHWANVLAATLGICLGLLVMLGSLWVSVAIGDVFELDLAPVFFIWAIVSPLLGLCLCNLGLWLLVKITSRDKR